MNVTLHGVLQPPKDLYLSAGLHCFAADLNLALDYTCRRHGFSVCLKTKKNLNHVAEIIENTG